jgi:ubiquitin-conjugating enzyme E2 J2
MMSTPSGRFQTNTKLCLSMSDFHPESWNPLWSVGTILTGLLSFMSEDGTTTGSIQTTSEEKKAFARSSMAFNCKNPTFRKLFPDLVDKYESKASTSSADVDAGGEEEEEGGKERALEKDEGKEAGSLQKEEKAEEKKKGSGGKGGVSVLLMASLIVAVVLVIIGGGW